jgi:AraC-like DNA-binding protein
MAKAKFKPQRTRPKQSIPTVMAYRLRTFGWIRNQPYHSTHGTHGDDVMLTVVRSGRGFYLHDNERSEVVGGMVGLVLPQSITGQDVGILMADPDDPYDHDYCRFAGHQAIASVKRILAANDGHAFFFPKHMSQILDLMQQMRSFRERHSDMSQQVDTRPPTPMEGLLACTLAVLEMPEHESEDEKNLSATKLRRYLHDHMAQPLSLDRMAEHFTVSKEHLCRVAKSVLGVTLVTVAEQIKIDWATVLLHQPELSIADVARRVGYVDPLYFSKVFRKHMGASPRQWRETL